MFGWCGMRCLALDWMDLSEHAPGIVNRIHAGTQQSGCSRGEQPILSDVSCHPDRGPSSAKADEKSLLTPVWLVIPTRDTFQLDRREAP